MIAISFGHGGVPLVSIGIENCIVDYVRLYGEIIGLDGWANELGITPHWARRCAHSAERKHLVKLTRLNNKAGRPYQVTALEERHHEN